MAGRGGEEGRSGLGGEERRRAFIGEGGGVGRSEESVWFGEHVGRESGLKRHRCAEW